MRIRVFPLDFMGQQPLLEPVNRTLHDMAVEYCERELADKVNLTHFSKVWVACVTEDDKPVEVVGISGYVMKIDVPMFRVTGENAVRATKMLTDRMNDFFADQGATGAEVFLHISSKERPEQRCENWQESLDAVGAKPADRFSIKVK